LTFALWQPAWDEAGIGTFPVDAEAKKPLVGNFLKAGRPVSRQWADKFPDAKAFGFACGPRNRLTVLDVDEPSENLLADAFATIGASPAVVRTASGKFHAYYRHNGEGRSIKKLARQLGLAGPVDILGQGGFAIAPPSCKGQGAYTWLQGSLGDLANLPVMRLPTAGAANDTVISAEQVREGERNAALFSACREAARTCQSLASLVVHAHTLNASGTWSALGVDEVERTASSAWRYQQEGRNFGEGQRYVSILEEEAAVIERCPDANYLFTQLRRRHWGRDFCIANDWRLSLPCGRWSLPRFKKARDFLLSSGLVVQVSTERRGVAAKYRFRSPRAGSGGRGCSVSYR
jgi:hypothetical protein